MLLVGPPLPVLMPATAVIGGLLPIVWGGGTGATVMKRIAAPMVGRMVSATVLTFGSGAGALRAVAGVAAPEGVDGGPGAL